MNLSRDLDAELVALEARDLRRIRREVGGLQGPWIELHGRRVLCLASNNYLGLANHPEVEQLQVEQLQVVIVIVLSSWKEVLDKIEATNEPSKFFQHQGNEKA